MNYELSGKLVEKFDIQKIGENFQKREFILEIVDSRNGTDYTDYIKFQLVKDKCSVLDNFGINEDIKVNFNIRGRKYEKEGRLNYFTSLEAWKLEKLVALRMDN
ncbi:MAG: DUF3127 domain-containing protein [Ignavibacteriae bacterium]|nr:DUF3127 domain-containing protein [Ignavibacteriota bacterium]